MCYVRQRTKGELLVVFCNAYVTDLTGILVIRDMNQRNSENMTKDSVFLNFPCVLNNGILNKLRV